MSKARIRRARRVVAVAALLLLTAALALVSWLDPDPPSSPDDEATRTRAPDRWTPPSGPDRVQDDGDPGEEAGEAPTASNEPFVVTVLGPGDEPLRGVRIHDRTDPTRFATTGDDGRANIAWGEQEEILEIRLSGIAPESNEVLTRRDTVLRVRGVVGLEVVLVDGDSGYRLSGGSVALMRSTGEPVPLVPTGDRHALPVSPLGRGQANRFRLAVTPPPGYALERPDDGRVHATISRFAKRVLVPIALRREAVISVRVVRTNRGPVAGVVLAAVSPGNRRYAFEAAPTDAGGETIVRGVPLIRGERVKVVAAWMNGQYSTRLRMARDPLLWATITLPEADPTAFSVSTSIGIGGGAGGAFGGRGSRRTMVSGGARIEIQVRRRDGTPAAEIRVRLDWIEGGRGSLLTRADEQGMAAFDHLPSGRARISVPEVGFVDAGLELDVRRGVNQSIEYLEAEGLPGPVLVLDEQGEPVPFARLDVGPTNGVAYSRLEGDTQVLRLHTDAWGRAVIDRLPPGSVKITARFGTRSASRDVAAGGQVTLHLGK